jgi:hypothetical protein
VFIVKTYWITGSIKNCQRRFVEQFGGKQAPRISPHDWLTNRAASSWLSLSYLIFSCYQLPLCEFPKHLTALHYRYDMQMYCTFVLFVNQHFLGLPTSGTHCILKSTCCWLLYSLKSGIKACYHLIISYLTFPKQIHMVQSWSTCPSNLSIYQLQQASFQLSQWNIFKQ